MSNPMKLAVTAGLIALALAGCGDKENKAPSQVLAKVNDSEITVHQLNALVAQRPQIDDAGKQQLLDQLIDQDLLVQKATSLKLDRDPNILQAIEFSRRQILAQAAAEREFGKAPEPSQAQIDDFYKKNPAMFGARKVYDFTAFLVQRADLTPELNKALENSKNPGETQKLLGDAGIKYESSDAKRAPEQMPVSAVPRLATMNAGDILILPEGQAVVLFQLKSSSDAPVSLELAAPQIKRFLQNEDAGKNAQAKMAALRTAAKIEYVQRFASATAQANPSANASGIDEDPIKAGLKGLK